MIMKRRSVQEAVTPSFIPVSDHSDAEPERGPFGGAADRRTRSDSNTRSSSVSPHRQQQQQQQGRKPNRSRTNTSPVPNSPLAPATRFGPSAPNPNANWQNKKGTWLTNLVIIWTIRLMFAVIPGISKELSWTLTNCAYGLVRISFSLSLSSSWRFSFRPLLYCLYSGSLKNAVRSGSLRDVSLDHRCAVRRHFPQWRV